MRGEHEGRRRVVLDTNVLVSALAFRGTTNEIWRLVEIRAFELFVSSFILSELRRSLIAKVRLSEEEVDLNLEEVREYAHEVYPRQHVDVVKRKDSDNRILECALEVQADVLVTGNMRDLKCLGEFRGIRILTPREFLLLYSS